MNDMLVTCPTCKGAREMMKLGGMFGKCNLCHGSGKIKHSDLPVIKPIVAAENVAALITKVGEAIPWSGNTGQSVKAVPVEAIQEAKPIEETLKVERKKAIYKRKTTAA